MRFHPLFSVASVLLLSLAQLGCGSGKCDPNVPYGQPGSCANPYAADGSLQGKCRSGWTSSLCDPGLACVDNVCLICGGSNDACCQTPGGPNYCNAGLTCDSTDFQWPTCTSGCGGFNQVCCGENTCMGDLICGEGGTCTEGTSNPCGGGFDYYVYVVDQYGCAVQSYPFTANNDMQAQACADFILQQNYPDGTHKLGPLDTMPSCPDQCVTDAMGNQQTQEPCYFSDTDKQTCDASLCGSETCAWTDGACP